MSERHPIGVYVTLGNEYEGELRLLKDVGISSVQLDWMSVPLQNDDPSVICGILEELNLSLSAVFVMLEEADWTSLSTVHKTLGFSHPERRQARLEMGKKIASTVADLGVKVFASHLGRIPTSKYDPNYSSVRDAVVELADHCQSLGMKLSFETGPEPAYELRGFIEDCACPSIGVNLDPTNFVLYGSDAPLRAVEELAPYILDTHIKDGKWPTKADQLGEAVAMGEGDVPIRQVISAIHATGYLGPLTIEGEGGGSLAKAVEFLNNEQEKALGN